MSQRSDHIRLYCAGNAMINVERALQKVRDGGGVTFLILVDLWRDCEKVCRETTHGAVALGIHDALLERSLRVEFEMGKRLEGVARKRFLSGPRKAWAGGTKVSRYLRRLRGF